jgi:SAM-dependent methyltransferase
MSLASTYDAVAEVYAERFSDELARKPLDRELLADLAAELAGRGTVADLGCGPGHVAAHLAALGVETLGIDLSPGMIEVARRRYPGLRFEVGDLLSLALPDAGLAGAIAFYSLIHVPRASLGRATAEMHRVLAPGGPLLVAFHAGDGEIHADEFLGEPVSVDATLFQPDEMGRALSAAGFSIDRVLTRPPVEGEYPSTRAYVRAVA